MTTGARCLLVSLVLTIASGSSGCGSAARPLTPPRAEIQSPSERPARPPSGRGEAIARARARVAAQDYAGAVNALRVLDADEQSAAWRQVFDETLARDPTDAARLARALPRGNFQSEALARAAREWHARQPEAALAWALAVEDSSDRIAVLDTLAAELAHHEPRHELERLRALPSEPRRNEFLRLTAARWAREDPDAALAWAAGLPGELRAGVTTSIVFELAQTRPVRAAALVGALPEGRERALIFSSIAHTWIAVDPPAAEAWLRGLPAGAAKDAALAGMSAASGTVGARGSSAPDVARRRNRAVAMSRMSTSGEPGDALALPPGPTREAALQREFEARLESSPVRAASWLAELPAPDLTDERLRRLAREWFRQDPAAARVWFEQHVASPQRREQIILEAR